MESTIKHSYIQESTSERTKGITPTVLEFNPNAAQQNIGITKLPKKVAVKFKIVPNDRKKHNIQEQIRSKRSQLKPKGPLSELYAEDDGPHWYQCQYNNPVITPPIIASKLQNFFKTLPIHGIPNNFRNQRDYKEKLQEFVGGGLNDKEFAELEEYCNPERLRTGKEMKMSTKFPQQGFLTKASFKDYYDESFINPSQTEQLELDLCILKKLKRRQERDENNSFSKNLKYKSVRVLPMEDPKMSPQEPPELKPGKDTLFRIRVYRPFPSSASAVDKYSRGRHSVFDYDIVVCGRTPLRLLRERIACRNNLDLRVDVSASAAHAASSASSAPSAMAEKVFPSGFLFINNVFYVDGRAGCHDISADIRRWAKESRIGDFQAKNMANYTINDIAVKLAHPEVYVHLGNCEHVFIFSEIRLVKFTDPLNISAYPCTTNISQHHTTLCTTCAGFGAKWLVTGCARVPFDPSFFCDICFKQYLYVDGQKVGEFKAYHFTANEVNYIKSQSSGNQSQDPVD